MQLAQRIVAAALEALEETFLCDAQCAVKASCAMKKKNTCKSSYKGCADMVVLRGSPDAPTSTSLGAKVNRAGS